MKLEEWDLEKAHPEYSQYKRKVPALIPSLKKRLTGNAQTSAA